MKRILTFCMLLAAICLTMASCESDTLPANEQATVEIDLLSKEDIADIRDAGITLNYRYGTERSSVVMEKSGAERYTAQLPSNSRSAERFIEVSLDKDTYTLTPEDLYFEGGKSYQFTLELTSSGLELVSGMRGDITGWESVDVEEVFATME